MSEKSKGGEIILFPRRAKNTTGSREEDATAEDYENLMSCPQEQLNVESLAGILCGFLEGGGSEKEVMKKLNDINQHSSNNIKLNDLLTRMESFIMDRIGSDLKLINLLKKGGVQKKKAKKKYLEEIEKGSSNDKIRKAVFEYFEEFASEIDFNKLRLIIKDSINEILDFSEDDKEDHDILMEKTVAFCIADAMADVFRKKNEERAASIYDFDKEKEKITGVSTGQKEDLFEKLLGFIHRSNLELDKGELLLKLFDKIRLVKDAEVGEAIKSCKESSADEIIENLREVDIDEIKQRPVYYGQIMEELSKKLEK